ncbi:efflux RND transporter periplasmic adaptor subunit [Clostridia bacterium]|nr:efflux RND transporter periplasmic adaptor subunit [Clostridia bacterium]
MKRRYKIGLTVVILVLIAAVFWVVTGDKPQSITSKVVAQEPLRQIFSASGKIVPHKTIDIQSQISGIIKSIPVSEGQLIEEGDILVELDNTDALNALEAAELRVEIAQSSLKELETSSLSMAGETLNQAKIALNSQEELVADYEYLYSNGALDQNTLENAIARYKALSSQYNSALANYRSFQGGGALNKSAKLQIEQAKKDLLSATTTLDKYCLVSPTSGLLTNIVKEEGEVVQAGTTILTIADEPNSYVLLKVDEKSIGKIELGQTASVWPEGNPNKLVPAVVDNIGSKVDDDTGTVDVRLKLDQSDNAFIQDLTVRAEILVKSLEEAIILPAEFLYDDNPSSVLVVEGDQTVVRTIRIEQVDLTNYLVLEGLELGDEIVLPNESNRLN